MSWFMCTYILNSNKLNNKIIYNRKITCMNIMKITLLARKSITSGTNQPNLLNVISSFSRFRISIK